MSNLAPTPAPSRVAAALVHTYTASGSVLAFFMIVAAVKGEAKTALWLFFVAMVIDGTDGLLARHFKVKISMPEFDGALLDNIVDYLTYVFAPVVLMWAGGHLPSGQVGWIVASLPLLASTYQFCRADAKTEDHFFLGFPSYWNVVAFYVIVLELGQTTTAWLITILAILVFVPVKYVYPSRTTDLWYLNMGLATVWLCLYLVIVMQWPNPTPALLWLSLSYVAFYTAESLALTYRHHRSAQPNSAQPS